VYLAFGKWQSALIDGLCSSWLKFVFALQETYCFSRRFLFGTTRILFGVDTPEGPPPQTPLLVPPPKQKGYQSAPFSNRHPFAYSSRPETEVLQSYGAKTEIRTPMHT